MSLQIFTDASGTTVDEQKTLVKPHDCRSEFGDQSSDFRYIFDDLQRSSQCCGVESPLDYNGSFWQRTETEYFLDYERRALNTSLDEDHVDIDETNHHHSHDDEELDSEDLLLPWSCCEVNFLRLQEEKERQQNEPEALANTIRHRLQSKSQVPYFHFDKSHLVVRLWHWQKSNMFALSWQWCTLDIARSGPKKPKKGPGKLYKKVLCKHVTFQGKDMYVCIQKGGSSQRSFAAATLQK